MRGTSQHNKGGPGGNHSSCRQLQVTLLSILLLLQFSHSQQPGPGPGPGTLLLSPAELLRVGSPGRAGEKIITEEGVSWAGQQGGVSDRAVVHAPAGSPVLGAARPLTPPYQAGRLVRQVGRVALYGGLHETAGVAGPARAGQALQVFSSGQTRLPARMCQQPFVALRI